MLFISALLTIAGCRKPENDLGLELLPGDPLGLANESAGIHAYTFRDDSIRTSGLTRNLLGSYLDPQFGTVKAGIVAQLRLSSSNVGSGQDNSGLVADSLVLSLAFNNSSYGYGALGAQTFKVYELSGDLSVDSLYYSNDFPDVLPEDLVASHKGTVVPRPLEAVFINGDSLAPQLRLRLKGDLADRFMDAWGTADLADNTAFLQFFKGLYITVENGTQLPFQNGILYFDLLNAQSKTTLYYRDELNDPGVPKQFEFQINENSVRYTVVEHDHTQALDGSIVQALQDTSTTPDKVFVQSLGGLRAALRFPDLMQHAIEGKALAKAELIVPVEGEFNPFLTPPAQLFLFRINEEGEEEFLPDQLSGIADIDGRYRSDAREYRFNITRYIQAVLNGSLPNNGIEMVPGSNGVTADRAVLSGPVGEGDRMRLLLTFTTY